MKALIVDDNKNDSILISRMLRSRGYEVVEAGNGAEALEQVEKGTPDIIVSDISMPVMDGFTLLKNLKENRKNKNIPFVFYTATYLNDKDMELGLSLGASRFLIKTMEPLVFLGEIRDVLKEFEAGELKSERPAITGEEYQKKYGERVFQKLGSKIKDLEKEIEKRKTAEDELRKWRDGLELKVKERTMQLEKEIEMHKKSEEALAESEKMYRTIFENTGTATFIIEEDTTISMANSTFEKLSGYKRDEVEGKKSWTEFILKEDLEKMKKYHDDRRIDELKVPQQYEFGFVDNKGNMRFGLISIAMIPGTKKSLASIIDITQRRRVEEELMLTRDEALRASSVKSEFLGKMSHELRTPLNAVLGFSELLKMKELGGLNAKQERFIDNIFNSGKHLLGLINDMLEMVKVESGEKLPLTIESLSAPKAIEETLIFVCQKARQKHIELKKEIDPELDMISADKMRFKQILLNLLDNGVKFSKPEGGTITIAARKNGDMAEFSICDTGIGLREEDMGQLFSLFHQADSGVNRRYEGTGVGLAITKQLVEQHGGRIWVNSKYGEGSTFTFTIPIEAKNDRTEGEIHSVLR